MNLRFAITLAALVIYFVVSGVSRAQTFDSFNPTQVDPYCLAPESDGTILIAGSYSSLNSQARTNIGRLLSDNSLDTKFTNGTDTFLNPSLIDCVTVQTNGQILVGGQFEKLGSHTTVGIGRYNADGSVDTNFTASAQQGYVYGALQQPAGGILIWGSFTHMFGQPLTGIAQLNNDGSRNTNFNTTANGTVNCIAPQTDGKLLVAGFFSSLGGQSCTNLGRLNPDGSFDSSFQPHTTNNMAFYTVAVQADGNILVGGLFFSPLQGVLRTNLVRLETNGTIDTNFFAMPDNHDSWGVRSIALQTDGKIWVAGDFNSVGSVTCPAIARLNTNGSLDTTFNSGASVGDPIALSVALQPDGKLLAGGGFNIRSNGVIVRGDSCRYVNNTAAAQSLSYDGTNITWLRSGSSPEVWQTLFDESSDGTNWIALGTGSRITGGWQLSGVSVPANASIRARGFATGGEYNGSGWIVESIIPQTPPVIVAGDGHFGFFSNYFGFNVTGSAGSTVTIEGSTNLSAWSPLGTNVLPNGPAYFRDTNYSNFTARYYRAQLQ